MRPLGSNGLENRSNAFVSAALEIYKFRADFYWEIIANPKTRTGGAYVDIIISAIKRREGA